MSRVPTSSFWKEPRATKAGIAVNPCYPAMADGRWYISTASGDQDATLSLKDGRLFLDLAVTNGGILNIANNRVAPFYLPASTT